MSKGKLTADFIRSNNITFAPKTDAEAIAIQKWLFRHGINWADSKNTICHVKESIEHGLIVQSGKLYYNNGKVSGIAVTMRDLDKTFKTAEEKAQEKIDRLEREVKSLHAKIDTLIELLKPANLDKPALVAKKTGRNP